MNDNYYNLSCLLTKNCVLLCCSSSDATGLGYIILTNGNPMLHAPSKFLGDQQSSYGLEFSVSISLSIITGLKDTIPIV